MNAKTTWREMLKEVIVSGVIAGGLDALKNGAKKAGDATVEKIISRMDERRGEMLAFIRGLAARDPLASENLIRRQRERQFCHPRSYGAREPYLAGDEDRFVTLLTKLYIALEQPDEKIVRREIFVWLGRLSDEDFDATIEFLHHDIFIQWLKRSWGWIKNVGSKVSSRISSTGLCQKIGSLATQIDQRAEHLADEITQGTQNRRANSLLGRLASRMK